MKNALLMLLLMTQACGQVQDKGQQSNLINPLEITDNELGFSCGIAGMSTRVVQLFTSLVLKNDYEAIRQHLYSESPAYRFMAVNLCNYYSARGLLTLTAKDQKAIQASYTSRDMVAICSGCNYRTTTTLGSLLKAEKGNMMRTNFNFWLKGMHPEQ